MEETKTTPEGGNEKTFTKTELDAIIGDRLARERQKYGDYDSLKAKAAEYDKAQEASKSELQKATEKAGALQKELDALKAANSTREAREKVAKEMEVPIELLTASTEEECKKQAEALQKYLPKAKKYPGARENESKKNQSTNGNEQSMREFAHQIFRKGE